MQISKHVLIFWIFIGGRRLACSGLHHQALAFLQCDISTGEKRQQGRVNMSKSPTTTMLTASRRNVLRTTLAEALFGVTLLLSSSSVLLQPSVAHATDATLSTPPITGETVIVKGQVTVASTDALAAQEASSGGGAALYITCRPDKADNIPLAILNGSRGKPPPVLSARIPNPSFPFDFELTIPRDLTLEGAWDGLSPPETIQPPTHRDQLWWNQMDLIVSARWDSDGVAATRSPEDLVGRGVWSYKEDESVVEVMLTGRGAFGKFATGGKK